MSTTGAIPADVTETALPAFLGRPRGGEPQPFDFRRPSKFSRDHIRALHIVQETFARQLSTVLSSTLRSVSQVALSSVSQLTYDEYLRSIPNPTYLAVLSLSPLNGAGLLHLPLPIAMAAVDRMLGGTGSGPYPNRPLTDIEAGLMRDLMSRAMPALTYAFESLAKLDPKVVQQESNPQFAQIAAPSDMVVLVTLDMRVGDEPGSATLCIPFTALQPVLESITGQSLFDRQVDDPVGLAAALDSRLEQVPVEVSVCFNPVALTSREILDLQVGDVLPLHHTVHQPLAVIVSGLPRLAARPGRSGRRVACQIVDPEQESER